MEISLENLYVNIEALRINRFKKNKLVRGNQLAFYKQGFGL